SVWQQRQARFQRLGSRDSMGVLAFFAVGILISVYVAVFAAFDRKEAYVRANEECAPWLCAPCQLRLLAGAEHGRTIPLADLRDECCICPPLAHHQCTCSTASTVVIPAIIEPVTPISAGVPRGNSRLISEAIKIAAIGRAMTK